VASKTISSFPLPLSDRFEIFETPLQGLCVVQRKPIRDERGYLERMFCASDHATLLQGRSIRQINRTLTVRCGTVRGMHFQNPPHAEMKFVSCLRGEVFDVAVDLRPDSPTRFQWHGEVLSSKNYKTLAIPEGFAHGFQTLSDHCEMLYFHTADYHRESEGGLNPLDPVMGIAWPLGISGISSRDSAQPMLKR
jgi:dTDP-4-dehydrorhamnose 3,5-epimerase